MRKLIVVLFIVAFAIASLGGTAAQGKSNLKTEITLDTKNPKAITSKVEKIEVPKITLNKKSPMALMGQKPIKISIVPGESNTEKATKIASRKRIERIAQTPKPAPKPVMGTPYTGGSFDPIYQAAGSAYGVPWQILAAVHSVETGQSGDTTIGSYAGAQGPMQFLPSTFRSYAVDGNGDGVASIYSVVDAIWSAANYISANMNTTGSIHGALYQYNHSGAYVNKVLSIARSFGYK